MKKIILFLLFSLQSHAFIVENINITGNNKTKKYIIENEIGFKEKQTISKNDLKIAKDNLEKLGIFSQVKITTNNNTVNIDLEEKWTTIPIVKLSSGGGVQQLTLGVYDPNILGHYFEMGTQYQRLEDTNSGVFWIKNPRLLGKKNGIDFQLWKTNRLRVKYDQKEDDPIVKNGFLHIRDKAYLAFTKELSSEYLGKVFYEFNQDKFSDKLIPPKAKSAVSQIGLPPDTKTHFTGFGLSYNTLKHNSYLVDGLETKLETKYGLVNNNIDNFIDTEISIHYFKSFKDHTFAQRIMTGGTNTNILQYWKYLGGLHHIRGFSDNRFSGKYYWLSNTEYRVPLIRKQKWILQLNTFFDMATTSEKIRDLSNLNAVSTGIGGRLIFPKIYRFVLRLDISRPLKKEDNNDFSFGVQQFF